MIIWGFRSFLTLLCMLRMECPSCGNEAAHRLVRSRRFFTLFFVPVLPVHTAYLLTCTFCGAASAISSVKAAQLTASEGAEQVGSPMQRWSKLWATPALRARGDAVRRYGIANRRALEVLAGAVIAAVVLGVVVGHVTQPAAPTAASQGETAPSAAPTAPPASASALSAGGTGASPSASPSASQSAAPPPPRVAQVQHFGHLLVEPSHQHVFLSSGTQGSSITVVDYRGVLVSEIDGLYGGSGLALSADQRTVYAALTNGDAVVAIDTATLHVRDRWSPGSHTCPASVAVAAGLLWVGEGCDGATGVLASFDPNDPAAGFHDAAPGVGFFGAPAVVSAGPSSSLLATAGTGDMPAELRLWRVAGPRATQLAAPSEPGQNLGDMAFSPGGAYLVTASSQPNPLERYATPSLSRAGSYAGTTFPAAVAYTADGKYVVAGGSSFQGQASVVYYDAASQAQVGQKYYLDVMPAGLAVTPDGRTVFLVTWDRSDPTHPQPVFQVFTGPAG